MDRMIELKVTKGGVLKKINVTQNMATMLFSDAIDAESKQRLIDNILSEQDWLSSENTQQRLDGNLREQDFLRPLSQHVLQKQQNTTKAPDGILGEQDILKSPSENLLQSKSMAPDHNLSEQELRPSSENSLQSINTSSDLEDFSSTSSSPEPVHQKPGWTESQESLLIDLRHEMANSFSTTRNHLSLWKTITEKMQEVLHVTISTSQAMYKYNALKKRWKEIIDSPTGSAAKKFVHKRAFDEHFGTKCSKPAYVIDTDNRESQSTESDSTTRKAEKSKPRKRRRDEEEFASLLEKHHQDFTKMHTEKMERFDKLISLIEMDIKNKKN